jgi:hypothetical protein
LSNELCEQLYIELAEAQATTAKLRQKRKIAERYAAGGTMAELAAEHECGEATIWRALQ